MPIDNDNSDYEAKRIEQRRQLEKQQAKALQEKDPLRSFEAKLSKDSVREEASRESLKKAEKDLKKSMEDKGFLLKKILGSEGQEHSIDLSHRAKEHEKAFLQQKALKGKFGEEKIEEQSDNQDVDNDKHETETQDRQHKTSLENLENEHAQNDQKILGVLHQGSGGSEGGSSGGENFGGGANNQEKREQSKSHMESLSNEDASSTQGVKSAPIQASTSSQGFGSGSGQKLFKDEDINEWVGLIQHGLLSNGEEMFKVTLNHDLFSGLSVETRRSPQGVILTFYCPNALIRSEMKKQHEAILKRFAEKNIQVHEVQFK